MRFKWNIYILILTIASFANVSECKAYGKVTKGDEVVLLHDSPLFRASGNQFCGTKNSLVIVDSVNESTGKATVHFENVEVNGCDAKTKVTTDTEYETELKPFQRLKDKAPINFPIHIFGGTNANFWGNPADANDSGPKVFPLFGMTGLHEFYVAGDDEWRPTHRNRWTLSIGGTIEYRGVGVDQALTANDSNTANGGMNVNGLASAHSVGVSANGTVIPKIGKFDTFGVGLHGVVGYEFLTGSNYTRKAQSNNGIYLRGQDLVDPLFYVQAGYGNIDYLTRNRFLIDISLPFGSFLGYNDKKNSFFSSDYSEFYFFANINKGIGGDTRDDVFSFGVKYLISASKLLGILNPTTTIQKN